MHSQDDEPIGEYVDKDGNDLEEQADLDSRLRDLLSDEEQIKHCCGQSGTNDIESDIKLLKQAFADEREQEQGFTAKDLGLMTGQEWYSRFEKELPRIGLSDAMNEAILEAAKRAAGLEGNS